MKRHLLIATALVLAGRAAVAKEPAVHVIIDPQPAVDGTTEVPSEKSVVLFDGIIRRMVSRFQRSTRPVT